MLNGISVKWVCLGIQTNVVNNTGKEKSENDY